VRAGGSTAPLTTHRHREAGGRHACPELGDTGERRASPKLTEREADIRAPEAAAQAPTSIENEIPGYRMRASDTLQHHPSRGKQQRDWRATRISRPRRHCGERHASLEAHKKGGGHNEESRQLSRC
jgi:hypothetical protein